MKMGARPTVTTHNLLVEQGILSVPKMTVKMNKKSKKEEVAAPAAAAAPAKAAAPAAASAPSARTPAAGRSRNPVAAEAPLQPRHRKKRRKVESNNRSNGEFNYR